MNRYSSITAPAEKLIIKPSKPRLLADPYIAPIFGKRGPCALCRNYSNLTEDHVPPEAVGNVDGWVAQSYMVASTANKDMYFGRQFRSGIKFRTLCASCNNGLGGVEDKAIISFYDGVQRAIRSPIIQPPIVKIVAQPNLIIRGLLAHFVAANDNGSPNTFDEEARELFFRKLPLDSCSLSLFYWIYESDNLFVMRDAFLTEFAPSLNVFPVQLLKFAPLATMFARKSRFHGLPNMMNYTQSRDEDEAEIPIFFYRRDSHPVWPVAPDPNGMILLHGNSYGLLAGRD